MGTQLFSPKWGQSPLPINGTEPPSPIFGPCLLWPNGWMDQDGTWHGDRPLHGPHWARWGPPSYPRQKRGQSPQFSAHFYCGQTAGCIKMPLGMEVGLSPGDVMLDGVAALPPPKRAQPPVFGSCLLWPNGWMDEDTTKYGNRPRPRPHCIRRGLSCPRKGHSSPSPFFGPCLLLPRLPISAAAEFLFQTVAQRHIKKWLSILTRRWNIWGRSWKK